MGKALSPPVYTCPDQNTHSFPYVDTLKVLEKWGPGCYFFPDGADKFIDELEELVVSLKNGKSSAVSPILAIFTELPSNPLLRSINFPRLRQLADKYEIPIVVDETVGNFANVDMMPYADIVVSSLSKLFSGQADVMGGRYVQGFHNIAHKAHFLQSHPQPNREALLCAHEPFVRDVRGHVF